MSVVKYAGTQKFHLGPCHFAGAKDKTHRLRKTPNRCVVGEVSFSRLKAAGLLVVAGLAQTELEAGSETIEDLVGPEPLEAMQRLVQRREFLVRDAADLLHGLDVLLIERIDDAADFLALRGQANADRTAIDARTLMIEEAEFDQLLQIIGDVGAEIVAARAQFARGQLLVADVIEQQRLYRIDIGTAATIEFILDDIEQAAMQPLNQRQSFEIERLNRSLPRRALDGFRRRCNGFHHDTSPVVVLSTYSTKLLSRLIATT